MFASVVKVISLFKDWYYLFEHFWSVEPERKKDTSKKNLFQCFAATANKVKNYNAKYNYKIISYYVKTIKEKLHFDMLSNNLV